MSMDINNRPEVITKASQALHEVIDEYGVDVLTEALTRIGQIGSPFATGTTLNIGDGRTWTRRDDGKWDVDFTDSQGLVFHNEDVPDPSVTVGLAMTPWAFVGTVISR